MTRLTIVLLVTTLVLWRHSFAQLPAGISFTPTSNQTAPFNSDDNITYDCEVDGNRVLIWVVSGASIEDNAPQFAAIGVFIENQGSNRSTLTITRQARDAYSREPISVRCSAFNSNPPRTDFSSFSYVVTYGVPNSPTNLMLFPSGTDLTLSWSPPTNFPPGVPVTYCVNITGAGVNNRTCDITTTSFTFPEDDDQAMCEMFQFSVTASNPAGDSVPTIIQDTIPISADLRNASRDLTIDYIDLTSRNQVFIQVSFSPARVCNARFPVTNYSVNVLGAGSATISNSNSSRVVIPVNTTTVRGLVQDRRYFLTISACIALTCRESRERTILNTTSVQNASLIFYETNILMTCTFATRTPALGCVITLAISNASTPEQFFISRNETGSRQCNTTLNRENAYTITEAVDWESDGTEGNFPIPIEPCDLEDPNNFTAITQCPLPEPPVAPRGGLTGGQIAGIVIAVLAAVAIIIAATVVIGVVFYKQRTGPWAKIKDMDDNNVAMDLNTSRLVGERKPKRSLSLSRHKETSLQADGPKPKKKEPLLGSSPLPKSAVSPSSALPLQSGQQAGPEKTTTPGGPPRPPSPSAEQKSLDSPDSLEKGLHLTGTLPPPSASIVPRPPDSPTSLEKGLHLTGPLPQPSTPGVEGQDSEEETPAFVLHILDNKKTRLQVNKEALRRAIRRHSEKTMSSITQSAGKVKKSIRSRAKPKEPRGKFLLPLRSIVQLDTYDSDDQADGDDKELMTLH